MEMTGSVSIPARQRGWQDKRGVFLTPQGLIVSCSSVSLCPSLSFYLNLPFSLFFSSFVLFLSLEIKVLSRLLVTICHIPSLPQNSCSSYCV